MAVAQRAIAPFGAARRYITQCGESNVSSRCASTKTFSSAARRNLRSKFKVRDDTLRSAAKVMYIGDPLRSAKGALAQRDDTL